MRANNQQFGGGGEFWGFHMAEQEMDALIMAGILSQEPSGGRSSIDVAMEKIVLSGLNAIADRAGLLRELDGPVPLNSLSEQHISELPTSDDGRRIKAGMVFLDDDHLGALDALAVISGGTPRSDVLRLAALEGVKIALNDPNIDEKRQRFETTAKQNADALRARVLGVERSEGTA